MGDNAGGAVLDRIVYRWQERDLLGAHGLGPVATSLAPERLPGWAAELGAHVGMAVDAETGPYTSVCWARTTSGPALIHREFALHGSDGSLGNVAHVLLDPGRVLGPHVVLALGLFDWADDGPPLGELTPGYGLTGLPAERFVAVAHERAAGLRAAARDQAPALERVAETLLAHPRAALSLLRRDVGPDPAPLLWGVFDLVSHLVRGSWSFSTYETGDELYRPRFVVVPRWPTGDSPGRLRIEVPGGVTPDVYGVAARRLVAWYTERPWEETRVLLRQLRPVVELEPEAKARRIAELLGENGGGVAGAGAGAGAAAVAGLAVPPSPPSPPVSLLKPRRARHAVPGGGPVESGAVGAVDPDVRPAADRDALREPTRETAGEPDRGSAPAAGGAEAPCGTASDVEVTAESPAGPDASGGVPASGRPESGPVVRADAPRRAEDAPGGPEASPSEVVASTELPLASPSSPSAARSAAPAADKQSDAPAVAPPRVERPRGPAPRQPDTRYLPVALPVPERSDKAAGGRPDVAPPASHPPAPYPSPGRPAPAGPAHAGPGIPYPPRSTPAGPLPAVPAPAVPRPVGPPPPGNSPAGPGVPGAPPPLSPPPSPPPIAIPPMPLGPPPVVAPGAETPAHEPAPRDWDRDGWAADGVSEQALRGLVDASRWLANGGTAQDREFRAALDRADVVAVAVGLERADEVLLPELILRLGELVVPDTRLPSARERAALERVLAGLAGPMRSLDRCGVARHQIASIIGQFVAYVLDGCQTDRAADHLAVVVRNLDTVSGTYRPYQQELIRAAVVHGLGARFFEEIGRLWAASRSLLPDPADPMEG